MTKVWYCDVCHLTFAECTCYANGKIDKLHPVISEQGERTFQSREGVYAVDKQAGMNLAALNALVSETQSLLEGKKRLENMIGRTSRDGGKVEIPRCTGIEFKALPGVVHWQSNHEELNNELLRTALHWITEKLKVNQEILTRLDEAVGPILDKREQADGTE